MAIAFNFFVYNFSNDTLFFVKKVKHQNALKCAILYFIVIYAKNRNGVIKNCFLFDISFSYPNKFVAICWKNIYNWIDMFNYLFQQMALHIIAAVIDQLISCCCWSRRLVRIERIKFNRRGWTISSVELTGC